MNFLADECCDAGIVELMREYGYDVLYVKEDAPGITDTKVLKRAFSEKRILITEDKDFGDLVYRLKKKVYGGFERWRLLNAEKFSYIINYDH